MLAEKGFGFIRNQVGVFLLGLLATGAGFFLVFLLTKDTETRYLVASILIPIILLSIRQQLLSARQKALLAGMMCTLILFFALPIMILMYRNVLNPPQWDFQLFWIFGRASATGVNPYQPNNLLVLAESLHPSEALLKELFFFHAPPTLFLFAPLGWFDIHTAFAVWYVAQMVVFLFAVTLLWKIFWGDSGLMGLMLSTTLALMFLPTWLTFYTGQTNFLLLVFVLLLWRDRDRPRAGLWLALGVFIKPIMLLLVLYPLLKRRWRIILSMIVTMGLAALLTSVVYGPNMVLNYFMSNPVANDMPVSLYTEGNVQSLLANIQRWTQYDQGTPLFQPIFLLAAFVLTGITSVLVYRLDERWGGWLLALNLVLALLLFPKTLTHYSFLLLAPLFLLVGHYKELPKGWWLASGLTMLVFYLVQAQSAFHFYAYLLTWLLLTGIGIWLLRHPSIISPNASPEQSVS